ncbi:hypothetical protein CVV26_00570 [Candidatus Kuenenbacteria bacterium HGW-Kuenenbacteria-1]|uniref:Peptidase S11 D-alanyl-D-alanine carboxypeptidase A N-terminal domain-containing protein n=1 Tax=Candidatus Kuenenbacteria bacterium HGW-Kuenenbacteria-1 TaxID=2013812 RepID=A0A2N1UPD2_9BACT|nr:MAG: hypothetical protein CVV26_00570 [Candidatus Kuenenbacteria bacterium HGW-Kuenenbacteria-1]
MKKNIKWLLIILTTLLIIFFGQLINLFSLELTNNTKLISDTSKINLMLPKYLEKDIFTKFNTLPKQTTNIRVDLKPAPLKSKEPIRINKQNPEIKLAVPNGIVVDLKTKKILWQKKPQEKKSIASLTKLMSALIFLETNPDLMKKIKIIKEDEIGGARLNVNFKEEIKTKDLFYAGLIGSKNNAFLALNRSTGLNKKDFVKKMNEKAQKMGLKNTYFVEPTGLDPDNLSTALEIAILAKQALKNQEIKKILIIDKYNFDTFLGLKKIREIIVENTNELLGGALKIKAGKTGFSNEAGSCLVIQAENKDGNEIIAVLLGNKTKKKNFIEMKNLIEWIFENYKWKEKKL